MMPWFYSVRRRRVEREKRKIAFPRSLGKFHFIWILFTVKTYKYVINHFLSGNLEFIFMVEWKIFEKWRLVICYDMGNTVSNWEDGGAFSLLWIPIECCWFVWYYRKALLALHWSSTPFIERPFIVEFIAWLTNENFTFWSYRQEKFS